MLKKTITSAVAAALLATGGLAAATGSAAAGPVKGGIFFGGPGSGFTIAFGDYQPYPTGETVCTPVFKKKKVWDPYQDKWVWKKIKVAEKCKWVPYY